MTNTRTACRLFSQDILGRWQDSTALSKCCCSAFRSTPSPVQVFFEVSAHTSRIHFHAAADGSQPLHFSLHVSLLLMHPTPASVAGILSALERRCTTPAEPEWHILFYVQHCLVCFLVILEASVDLEQSISRTRAGAECQQGLLCIGV